MSEILYNLSLPTSQEPQLNGKYGASYKSGWGESDRVVFKVNAPNRKMRPGTLRLNGTLQLLTQKSGVNAPVVVGDKVVMNPNAGLHGLIKSIQIKFGQSVVFFLDEYGRFVAMKKESKEYQIDNGTLGNSLCELRQFSNDAQPQGTDFKPNQSLGLLYTNDKINTGAENPVNSTELPFSLRLECPLNNCQEHIPFNRTGEIEVSITWQESLKSGIVGYGLSAGQLIKYVCNNLELRFMADPEDGANTGAIIMETASLQYCPPILNSKAGLEFNSPNAFDAVVCSFLNVSHVPSDSSLYDYLATEAITEQISQLEVKVNNTDDFLEYPLTLQTVEILYNYLLSFQPYINAYDDTGLKKHGLSYAKLDQTVKSGFGIGCPFFGGRDSGTTINFNVSLNTSPTSAYNTFMYTIGRLIL
jgi:hypothetical protein